MRICAVQISRQRCRDHPPMSCKRPRRLPKFATARLPSQGPQIMGPVEQILLSSAIGGSRSKRQELERQEEVQKQMINLKRFGFLSRAPYVEARKIITLNDRVKSSTVTLGLRIGAPRFARELAAKYQRLLSSCAQGSAQQVGTASFGTDFELRALFAWLDGHQGGSANIWEAGRWPPFVYKQLSSLPGDGAWLLLHVNSPRALELVVDRAHEDELCPRFAFIGDNSIHASTLEQLNHPWKANSTNKEMSELLSVLSAHQLVNVDRGPSKLLLTVDGGISVLPETSAA